MRIRERVAEAMMPDGATVTLVREGDHYVIAIDGGVLMSSEQHGSEVAMGELGCAPIAGRSGARVAIGGLGMGFTLRAVLDCLAPDASVTVVEFLPALVEWNRTVLAPLAQSPLDDPRVTLEVADFVAWVKSGPDPFDAIALDLDNGPEAFTTPANGWLYSPTGLSVLRSALRPGGVLSVWSAGRSPQFESRMQRVGFQVEAVALRGRPAERKGSRHTLYVGRIPATASGPRAGAVPAASAGARRAPPAARTRR